MSAYIRWSNQFGKSKINFFSAALEGNSCLRRTKDKGKFKFVLSMNVWLHSAFCRWRNIQTRAIQRNSNNFIHIYSCWKVSIKAKTTNMLSSIKRWTWGGESLQLSALIYLTVDNYAVFLLRAKTTSMFFFFLGTNSFAGRLPLIIIPLFTSLLIHNGDFFADHWAHAMNRPAFIKSLFINL